MCHLVDRLKYIYLPYLLISICCIVGYSLLHWLLIIGGVDVLIKEIIIDFWVPLVLAGVLVFGFLQRSVKLLKLKQKNGKDLTALYIILAGAAIVLPSIIAQSYVETATAKLTALNNITEITKHPRTRYYTFKHFYTDKLHSRVHQSSETSGRYGEHLNFSMYVVCPVYKDEHSVIRVLAAREKGAQLPIVFNGKFVMGKNGKIDQKDITSFTVLKPEQAVRLYGDAGSSGVILIKSPKILQQLHFQEVPLSVIKHPVVEAWFCKTYHKQISNSATQAEKEAEWKSFYENSFNSFERENLNNFEYLERIGKNDSFDGYKAAVEKGGKGSYNSDKAILLEAKDTPYAERNGDNLQDTLICWVVGSAIWLILILIPRYKPALSSPVVLNKANQRSKKPISLNSLDILLPKPGLYVTPVLIDVNLLVFAIMVCCGVGFISFSADDLLAWGANYGPVTTGGQWWRLLTSTFLHGGIMHLVMNMFTLLFVGVILEPMIGTYRYLLLYMLSGVAASLTSMYWHSMVSVGASGAIFGLYGAFLALITTPLMPKDSKKAFAKIILPFIGINLFYGMFGNIDNAAHVGGLLSGILIGYALYFSLKQAIPRKSPKPEIIGED